MQPQHYTPQPSYQERRFLDFWTRLKMPYTLQPQYPVRGFYLDYAELSSMTAIEIDGSYHLTVEQQERDKWRQAIIERDGWYFVRISGKAMQHDPVRSVYRVKAAIERRLKT